MPGKNGNTRVAILSSGSLSMPAYRYWWNGDVLGNSGLENAAEHIRLPVYSVLIDHSEGLFLLDTGFDYENTMKLQPYDLPEQTEEETIPAQLALLGYKPEDVQYIINSHLHADHVGYNKHMPHATIMVHEKEFENAKNPEFFQDDYSDLAWAPQFDRDRRDADNIRKNTMVAPAEIENADARHLPKFDLLSGDVEIAKGVWLIETPGHSVGHYSCLIEMKDRPAMLFTVDATYTRRNLEETMVPGIHLSPASCIKSIQRLQMICAAGAEPFFPHDMEAFKTYKKAPYWYE